MTQANVDFIRRSFVLWGERGEPPWELLADDAVIRDHDIPDADEYVGRAGAEQWLADWDSAWSDFSIEPEEFLDANGRVVAFVRMKAVGRGSSVPVERADALVYELAGDKIARIDYYNDRAQAIAAATREG